ncbi:hypothetical protein NPIL_449361, partial [Nephila pilipes]
LSLKKSTSNVLSSAEADQKAHTVHFFKELAKIVESDFAFADYVITSDETECFQCHSSTKMLIIE